MRNPSAAILSLSLLAAAPLPASAQAVIGVPLPRFPNRTAGAAAPLLGALRDTGRGAAERGAAAEALIAYVQGNGDVRRALVDILYSRSEEDELRRQAARSLSVGGNASEVPEALLYVAADARETDALRGTAYKSLYAMANRAEVARALQDAIADASVPGALRAAAAWGAFKSAGRADMRAALLGVLGDSAQEEGVRLEALKSLYSTMNLAEVTGAVERLAQDARLGAELRRAAAMALVSRAGESAVRALLVKLAAEDPDPLVQRAAAKALTGTADAATAEFFHLDAVPPFGYWRNPLEGE